ncbi:MAG TPA: hypothetical protein PK200_02420 [Spirochaetota bacterium]|nr:hypothetical protein [Spirochaetota bacterium]
MEKKSSLIIIRPMEIHDLHTVFLMGVDMFRSINGLRYYGRWNEENLAELFAGFPEYALVASRKKQLLGFALGGVIQGPDTADAGYILWSAVKDREKFQGIREELLGALFTVMRAGGLKTILCPMDSGDTILETWCRKNGFLSTEHDSIAKWFSE